MGSITAVRKPPHNKTFGMEIEAYPVIHSPWWNDGIHTGFWEATYDSSLSFHGIEWVCQPMPYSMLIKQINRLHRTLSGWRVDHRCGLHIHVSRGYWSDKREMAFTQFLCGLTSKELETLFGRDSSYARPYFDRDDKYRAINVLHPATFEFRLWAAGDLTWTLEALRRTKLIVEYRGKWTMDNILALFTEPDVPLLPVFQEAASIPAVRRVRRAPAVPV